MLRSGIAKTFKYYDNTASTCYTKTQIQNIRGLILDVYMPNSLKSDTKQTSWRCSQVCWSVKSTSKSLEEFQRLDKNKTEISSFLARTIAVFDGQVGDYNTW